MLSVGRLVPVWPISNSATRSIVCSWQSFSDGWPSEADLDALNSVPQGWPCCYEQYGCHREMTVMLFIWLLSLLFTLTVCAAVLSRGQMRRWWWTREEPAQQWTSTMRRKNWKVKEGWFLATRFKCDNNILFPNAETVQIWPYVSPGLIFSEIITSSHDCS